MCPADQAQPMHLCALSLVPHQTGSPCRQGLGHCIACRLILEQEGMMRTHPGNVRGTDCCRGCIDNQRLWIALAIAAEEGAIHLEVVAQIMTSSSPV